LFNKIKWSFERLYSLLQTGYKALKDLRQALTEYAMQSGIVKWTAKQLDSKTLREIDEWLSNHPKTRRFTGIVIAAILIYCWWNMSFVGLPGFDFDLGDMIMALQGSFSLTDIFAGSKGAMFLLLFLTGTLSGITFPWPGPGTI